MTLLFFMLAAIGTVLAFTFVMLVISIIYKTIKDGSKSWW